MWASDKKSLLLHHFGKRAITLYSWITNNSFEQIHYQLKRDSLKLAHFMVFNFPYHVRRSDFNSNKFQPECQLFTVFQTVFNIPSKCEWKHFCWWFRPTNAHFNYILQLSSHTSHIRLWCIQVNCPMSFYLVFCVNVLRVFVFLYIESLKLGACNRRRNHNRTTFVWLFYLHSQFF